MRKAVLILLIATAFIGCKKSSNSSCYVCTNRIERSIGDTTVIHSYCDCANDSIAESKNIFWLSNNIGIEGGYDVHTTCK